MRLNPVFLLPVACLLASATVSAAPTFPGQTQTYPGQPAAGPAATAAVKDDCMVVFPAAAAPSAEGAKLSRESASPAHDVVRTAQSELRVCEQKQVLYLNFFGQATIGASRDDLAQGFSSVVGYTLGSGSLSVVPAYSGGAFDRAEILHRVREHFARFFIEVVDVRPDDPNHTMVVIGGRPSDVYGPQSRRLAGVAPLDCQNELLQGIGFVFAEDIGPSNVAQIAQSIAHEAGHMFGLLHVVTRRDHMYKSVVGDPLTQSFLDEDNAVDDVAESRCGGRSRQNSVKHLATALPVCPLDKADNIALATTGDGTPSQQPANQGGCAFTTAQRPRANNITLLFLVTLAIARIGRILGSPRKPLK